MFVAELSALDLGNYVKVFGVAKGSRYHNYYGGILTEVKHNSIPGYTSIRIRGLGSTGVSVDHVLAEDINDDEKRNIQRAIAGVEGRQYTFPHGVAIDTYKTLM